MAGKRGSPGKELTMKKYGRLRVMEKTDRRDSYSSIVWRCLCSCGNPQPVFSSTRELNRTIHGKPRGTRSCGCLDRENHAPQVILTREQIALYATIGARKLAERIGFSHQGILNALRRQGVPVRKRGGRIKSA